MVHGGVQHLLLPIPIVHILVVQLPELLIYILVVLVLLILLIILLVALLQQMMVPDSQVGLSPEQVVMAALIPDLLI